MSFASFGLNPRLLKTLEELGFDHPTSIQTLAIPPLMEGKDVMATAVTGSGKTAAFLLPILHRIMDKPRGTTRALVLAPTRELAAQIAEHLRDLAAHTPLKGMAVYGGVSMGPQENALRKGADVIIATPGRLLDHFQYPYAKLSGLEYLVLDEGDRMLDMGFLPDIRRILKHIPQKRQNLLFSATLPLPIVELAQEFLHNPVALNVHRKSAPAAGITHVAYPVPHELKSGLLLELLKKPEAKSVLAFTRTRHRAKRLTAFLEKRGISCTQIHGSRSQAQRTEALAGFKRGKFRVLVATDIAARGIDVEALGLVVNFDVPNLPEDYIHRVGRTARLQLKGDAYTFVSPDEEGDLRTIEKHLGKALPREKVEGFDYAKRPEEKLEIPLPERIAAIRARKAEERARSKAKAEKREAAGNTARPAKSARPHSERGPHPSPWSRNKGTQPERPAHTGARAEVDGNRQGPHTSSQGLRRQESGHSRTGPRAEVDGNKQGPHTSTPVSTRQESGHSHKHEQGGQSHWAKAWKQKNEAGKPQEEKGL